MGNFVNINGKTIAATEASVAYDNRAFRYGYGLFETLLIRNGQIELEKYHFERLFEGMLKLHFKLPKLWNEVFFKTEILKIVQRNKLDNLARVRLQVWNGNGGLYDAETGQPQYIIECFELAETVPEWNENGLTIGIANGFEKSMDSLANLKSCNALIYAIAAQEAKKNKWNDALILNTNKHIIESTIANIFWVKEGKIFTPNLEEGCVAGVMRRHLLSVKQLTITEQPLTQQLLIAADEVFLTNAIRKIKWIRQIGEKSYGGKITAGISDKISSPGYL